jgi:hypothetical protein
VVLRARHFAEDNPRRPHALTIAHQWFRNGARNAKLKRRGSEMKQSETMTKRKPIVANNRLEQLMALANEIARYASTNDKGQFERARSWQ